MHERACVRFGCASSASRVGGMDLHGSAAARAESREPARMHDGSGATLVLACRVRAWVCTRSSPPSEVVWLCGVVCVACWHVSWCVVAAGAGAKDGASGIPTSAAPQLNGGAGSESFQRPKLNHVEASSAAPSAASPVASPAERAPPRSPQLAGAERAEKCPSSVNDLPG